MGAYLIKRGLLAVLTIWVISMLSFFIIELPPGDSITMYVQQQESVGQPVSDAMAEVLRDRFSMNKPLVVRYSKWMWRLLRADPGWAFARVGKARRQQKRVLEVIDDRIWTTVALAGFTILLTWSFAIPIGIYSAVRQHSVGDYTFTFLGFTGLAVPDFLLGLVLMYLAFAYFDQSVGGLYSNEYTKAAWSFPKVWDLIKHLWIPAVVLGTSGTASLIRVMRNNLLDELSKPYVVTARSKGMSPWRIVFKYPVRVAANPLISTVGYLLPYLIGGSVIVSVVLSLPTLGPTLLMAIQEQEVHMGAFILLLLGSLTVIGTLASDILLALVDPRIKFGTLIK